MSLKCLVRDHKRKKFLWIVSLVSAIAASVFWPLPYYVQMPGQAIALSEVVQVGEEGTAEIREGENMPGVIGKDGVSDEIGWDNEKDGKGDPNGGTDGELMMTTVNMLRSTPFLFLYALMSPNAELIALQKVRVGGESSKEFTMRQLAIMKESQENAIIAAFQGAGMPIGIRSTGVKVLGLVEGMPAIKQLHAGDVITHVNDHPVSNSEKLLQVLSRRKAGEEVVLRGERAREPFEVRITMAWLPVKEGEFAQRAGIGIVPGSLREVTPSVPVHFDTKKIGGPSAGLMFALEILDQLLPQDLTYGHLVAGTGTIDEEGSVGQIGGIEYKVVAADREGADIFLAPADRTSYDTNALLAEETAKRIGTSMQVVPVQDLSEAVKYLEKAALTK